MSGGLGVEQTGIRKEERHAQMFRGRDSKHVLDKQGAEGHEEGRGGGIIRGQGFERGAAANNGFPGDLPWFHGEARVQNCQVTTHASLRTPYGWHLLPSLTASKTF